MRAILLRKAHQNLPINASMISSLLRAKRPGVRVVRVRHQSLLWCGYGTKRHSSCLSFPFFPQTGILRHKGHGAKSCGPTTNKRRLQLAVVQLCTVQGPRSTVSPQGPLDRKPFVERSIFCTVMACGAFEGFQFSRFGWLPWYPTNTKYCASYYASRGLEDSTLQNRLQQTYVWLRHRLITTYDRNRLWLGLHNSLTIIISKSWFQSGFNRDNSDLHLGILEARICWH